MTNKPVLPERCFSIKGMEGLETYKIDEYTIGVRHKWISVKDRLPELYNFVLVLANFQGTGEPKPCCIARLEEDKKWDFSNHIHLYPNYGAWQDIEYEICSDDITHWMTLPEIPK